MIKTFTSRTGMRLLSAALLYERDEALMNLLLDRLDPFHVVGLLRQKRIEHRFAIAGGVKPPLDADLLHEFGKAKSRADHAYRSDDRELVADDLIAGAGQHVAA